MEELRLPQWYLNRKFTREEIQAINEAHNIVVIKETDKAKQVTWFTDYGNITRWIPKSIANVEYDKKDVKKAINKLGQEVEIVKVTDSFAHSIDGKTYLLNTLTFIEIGDVKMKENVYVIWVEKRLGHIDDNEEDMETEVELYEIVDCLEKAEREILKLNTDNLDHWNVGFWYSEEPLISDTTTLKEDILNDSLRVQCLSDQKDKEIERLNNVIKEVREKIEKELDIEKICRQEKSLTICKKELLEMLDKAVEKE